MEGNRVRGGKYGEINKRERINGERNEKEREDMERKIAKDVKGEENRSEWRNWLDINK